MPFTSAFLSPDDVLPCKLVAGDYITVVLKSWCATVSNALAHKLIADFEVWARKMTALFFYTGLVTAHELQLCIIVLLSKPRSLYRVMSSSDEK